MSCSALENGFNAIQGTAVNKLTNAHSLCVRCVRWWTFIQAVFRQQSEERAFVYVRVRVCLAVGARANAIFSRHQRVHREGAAAATWPSALLL